MSIPVDTGMKENLTASSIVRINTLTSLYITAVPNLGTAVIFLMNVL